MSKETISGKRYLERIEQNKMKEHKDSMIATGMKCVWDYQQSRIDALEKENQELKKEIELLKYVPEEVKEYEKSRKSVVEIYVKAKEENETLKQENKYLKDFLEYLDDVVVDGSYVDAYEEFLAEKE